MSHDRDFLDGLTDRIYEIKNEQISVHHFGIKEFLNYRKKESIVDFEHNSNPIQKSKDKVISQNKKDYLEKKKDEKKPIINQKNDSNKERMLKNKISRLEVKIAELETKIKELDQQISGLDYSDKVLTEKVLGAYNLAKSELDKTYQDWENTSDEIDAIS